jgi:hypothetical protein
MQTPLEVDFQSLSSTPQIHARLVAQLEQRYGRVTSRRVA